MIIFTQNIYYCARNVHGKYTSHNINIQITNSPHKLPPVVVHSQLPSDVWVQFWKKPTQTNSSSDQLGSIQESRHNTTPRIHMLKQNTPAFEAITGKGKKDETALEINSAAINVVLLKTNKYDTK